MIKYHVFYLEAHTNTNKGLNVVCQSYGAVLNTLKKKNIAFENVYYISNTTLIENNNNERK